MKQYVRALAMYILDYLFIICWLGKNNNEPFQQLLNISFSRHNDVKMYANALS